MTVATIRRTLHVAAVTLAALALSTSTASATAGWYDSHTATEKQALVNLAYRTASRAEPYTGSAVPLTDVLSQGASTLQNPGGANVPVYRAIVAANADAPSKLGLWPRIGKILGPVAQVAGVFSVGWAIGTGVNEMVLHQGVSTAGSLPGISSQTLVPHFGWPDSDAGHPTSTYGGAPDVRPTEDTVQWTYNSGSLSALSGDLAGTVAAPSCSNYGVPGPTGYGFTFSKTGTWNGVSNCTGNPGSWPAFYFGHFWKLAKDTIDQPVHHKAAGETVTNNGVALPTDPNLTTSTSSVTNFYDAAPSSYAGWLDSKMGHGDDPLSTYATVPSCTGDLYAACLVKLDAAGFTTHTRSTRTFATADVTKPADAVLGWTPTGTHVDTATSITVDTNPSTAAMPLLLPAPDARELYTAYAARLAALGLATVTRTDLSDAASDATRGPNEAVRTSPATGTRLLPATAVEVYTNPPGAPSPPASPWFTPPTVPAVDFAPFAAIPSPCDVFPFGVPCWMASAIDQFAGSPVTPSFSFHFPYGGAGDNTTVNLVMFEPYMGAVRAVTGLTACMGILWLFYGLAFGGVAGKGSKDD
jgi:hypothetical protein